MAVNSAWARETGRSPESLIRVPRTPSAFRRHTQRVARPDGKSDNSVTFCGLRTDKRCLHCRYEFVNYCSPVPATSCW